jgi:hypothetical protein
LLKTAVSKDIISNYATHVVKKEGKQLTGKALAKEISEVERQLKKGTLSIPVEGEVLANGQKITKAAITEASKNLSVKSAITNSTSSLMAAIGESRIEGVHAGQEFKEQMLQELYSDEMQEAIHNEIMQGLSMTVYDSEEEYQQAYNTIYQNKMQQALQSINTNAGRTSVFTATANMPILLVSNFIQFSKVLGKEFYANKRFWRSLGTALAPPQEMAVKGAGRIAVDEAGKAVLKGAGKLGTAANIGKTIIKNAVTEGI